jgi:enoyl-CoA hydratase
MTDVHTETAKLLARKHEGIGWIVFNNPRKRNAMSRDMFDGLVAVLAGYADDPEVRVVILRGEGDKAFVSGADISQFAEGARTAESAYERALQAIIDFPKPTIAMIRGYCLGGGLGIAIACDMRIAAEDARFGIPAAKLGLGYGYGGLKRLSDVVGPAYTAEIFYTGRQFDAGEAREMGLVNRVRAVDDLERYTVAYAVAMVRNAPLTLRAVKRCLIEMPKDAGERDLARCGHAIDACFASADFVEGHKAFMERREPRFTGA